MTAATLTPAQRVLTGGTAVQATMDRATPALRVLLGDDLDVRVALDWATPALRILLGDD